MTSNVTFKTSFVTITTFSNAISSAITLKYSLTPTDTLLSTLFVDIKYSTKFSYEMLKQHQKQGFVEEIRDFCFSQRISNNDHFRLSPCSNLTDFHNPDTFSLSHRVSQKSDARISNYKYELDQKKSFHINTSLLRIYILN